MSYQIVLLKRKILGSIKNSVSVSDKNIKELSNCVYKVWK